VVRYKEPFLARDLNYSCIIHIPQLHLNRVVHGRFMHQTKGSGPTIKAENTILLYRVARPIQQWGDSRYIYTGAIMASPVLIGDS
jgi:hypothetical protein